MIISTYLFNKWYSILFFIEKGGMLHDGIGHFGFYRIHVDLACRIYLTLGLVVLHFTFISVSHFPNKEKWSMSSSHSEVLNMESVHLVS